MLKAKQRRLRARGDELEEECSLLAPEIVEDCPQVADRGREVIVAARVLGVLAQVVDVDRYVVAADESL